VIDQLLEAAEAALTGGDERRTEFIEDWVPKLVTHIQELEAKLSEARNLAALDEAQLLEAEAKLKELEE
jgi:hypothetical protein